MDIIKAALRAQTTYVHRRIFWRRFQRLQLISVTLLAYLARLVSLTDG